jgi:hypothetical protein
MLLHKCDLDPHERTLTEQTWKNSERLWTLDDRVKAVNRSQLRQWDWNDQFLDLKQMSKWDWNDQFLDDSELVTPLSSSPPANSSSRPPSLNASLRFHSGTKTKKQKKKKPKHQPKIFFADSELYKPFSHDRDRNEVQRITKLVVENVVPPPVSLSLSCFCVCVPNAKP